MNDLDLAACRTENRIRGERIAALEAKLEGMTTLLRECDDAITSVPDRTVFGVGIGGDGITHWNLADELLSQIDSILASSQEEQERMSWRRPRPTLTEIMPGLYAFKNLRRSRWIELKVKFWSWKIKRQIAKDMAAAQEEQRESEKFTTI